MEMSQVSYNNQVFDVKAQHKGMNSKQIYVHEKLAQNTSRVCAEVLGKLMTDVAEFNSSSDASALYQQRIVAPLTVASENSRKLAFVREMIVPVNEEINKHSMAPTLNNAINFLAMKSNDSANFRSNYLMARALESSSKLFNEFEAVETEYNIVDQLIGQ